MLSQESKDKLARVFLFADANAETIAKLADGGDDTMEMLRNNIGRAVTSLNPIAIDLAWVSVETISRLDYDLNGTVSEERAADITDTIQHL